MSKYIIQNIVYLHDSTDISTSTVQYIKNEFQDRESRKFRFVKLRNEKKTNDFIPLLKPFIDRIYTNDFSVDLFLLDYIPFYDNDKSSLFSLLAELKSKKLEIPWMLLNGPKIHDEIISDLKLFYDNRNNNPKYISIDSDEDKENFIHEMHKYLDGHLKSRPQKTINNLISKIQKVEEDDFLRNAIIGKHYIKTCLIPGSKNKNNLQNYISFSEFSERKEYETIIPDYFLIGGDYLLTEPNINIEELELPDLNNLKFKPRFVYVKSISDSLEKFKLLTKRKEFILPYCESINKSTIGKFSFEEEDEIQIFIYPEKLNLDTRILPIIIVDDKLKLSILNLSYIKNQQNRKITEVECDSIEKFIEEVNLRDEVFSDTVKIVFCHYDLFDNPNERVSNFEKYLNKKGFSIFVHDHVHLINSFLPQNFIHYNKDGLLRIACGHFDKPQSNSSRLKRFFITLHFIVNENINNSKIENFKIKVWSKKNNINNSQNFTFDEINTDKFGKYIRTFKLYNMEKFDIDTVKAYIEAFKAAYPFVASGFNFFRRTFRNLFMKKGINEDVTDASVAKATKNGTISIRDLFEEYLNTYNELSLDEKAISILTTLKFAHSKSSYFELNIDQIGALHNQIIFLEKRLKKLKDLPIEEFRDQLHEVILGIELEDSIYNILKNKIENEYSNY